MDSEHEHDRANPCFTQGTKTCVEIYGVISRNKVRFTCMDVGRFEMCSRAMQMIMAMHEYVHSYLCVTMSASKFPLTICATESAA
jgi:hypothetical protein